MKLTVVQLPRKSRHPGKHRATLGKCPHCQRRLKQFKHTCPVSKNTITITGCPHCNNDCERCVAKPWEAAA